jgi:glycine betaine/proline transport system substrate-binding protein
MPTTKIPFRFATPRLLPRTTGAILALAALLFTLAISAQASAADKIRFGSPTWPGVVVSTAVASQLVQAMGYQTKTLNASPAFIVAGMKSDDLDVYLGGWVPTEKDMIDAAVDTGKVKVLGKNISGAIMGLAVPKYVWDAGVHSEADLAKHADKFDHKIYAIEPGTGFNKAIQKAIDNDRDNLGDWKMIPSNTSVMLTQVKRAIKRKNWIVFLGWKPHWMNIAYDIKYLKAVGKPTIADTRSDVLTVVNAKLVDRNPQVAKFLKQYAVPNKVQSKWIYAYSKKRRRASEIVPKWIGSHLDRVGQWLDGVKTKDGQPAIDAVKEKFGS